MLRREEEIRDKAVWEAAQEVLLAVRTAPKTRGIDNISILIADGDEKAAMVDKMNELSGRPPASRGPAFIRDAKSVAAASAVIMVGAKAPVTGLDCRWCGFPTCAEKAKSPKVPCVFGAIDLGIGLGVAAASLAGKHIDNRMMYSMGVAALELGWFGPEVTMALGFPLSVTGKSPFFDRG